MTTPQRIEQALTKILRNGHLMGLHTVVAFKNGEDEDEVFTERMESEAREELSALLLAVQDEQKNLCMHVFMEFSDLDEEETMRIMKAIRKTVYAYNPNKETT